MTLLVHEQIDLLCFS